ncbi:4'-phosphopantetheinyl transferase superfamily protein [Spongiibacter sp. KMU-158]|uniref:4'-phosphopantetheinyl transferase superfamily protein n=1 Tax=Spongiibacter pelagi TaxID=2760804 RepID=A0A927C4N5_9GAMM|nr:4'-phosphopantetheinyl transferase superfamily protein [Spongiibacter pelagi]MBD2859686.1 4'-phosphopantetheinyl transferase superfamily protein [Spongiibacter pelagi]
MNVTTMDRFFLQAGQVDLWFFSTDDPRLQRELAEHKALLSSEEQAQSDQLLNPLQHRDFILNRAMLRSVLAVYGDFTPQTVDFSVNQFGKPQLGDSSARALREAAGHDLHFNTAYSAGISICAVARDDVGVDIESHPDSAGMLAAADDYLSKAELQALRAQPEAGQLAQFFRYWTLKEAWLKARGEGLSVSLQDFSMLLDGEQIGFDGPDKDLWQFRLLGQNDSHTAALALKGELANIRCFQASSFAEIRTLNSTEEAIDALSRVHSQFIARRA